MNRKGLLDKPLPALTIKEKNDRFNYIKVTHFGL